MDRSRQGDDAAHLRAGSPLVALAAHRCARTRVVFYSRCTRLSLNIMSVPVAAPFPPPPRRLSVLTYLLAPFGPWMYAGVGLLLMAVATALMVADATFLSRQLSDNDPQTTGWIVSAGRPTNSRGSSSNGPLHYGYVYEVGGKHYAGTSLSDEDVGIGERVSVAYVPRAPELSRVVGMDVPGAWAWWMLIMTVVIIAVALALIILHLHEMRRTLHWLRHCIAVKGTITLPNPALPCRFNFHFTDMHGRDRYVTCTGAPGQFAHVQSVLGAYLPALDHQAAPLDLLPKRTRRALTQAR